MKNVRLLLLLMLISVTLLSCSRKVHRHSLERYTANSAIMESSSDAASEEKKILFSAFLSLKVENPDSANFYIKNIAKKYDGYASQIGTYQTIIRVKSDSLNSALKAISNLGKVESKNISAKDVTDEYTDYQIRLENAEQARKRYLELLAKAENVEAALKIEKELERLNEKIDLLKGKISRINHLSEFSTITIELKEKKKLGILGYVGKGLYYTVKWFFVRN